MNASFGITIRCSLWCAQSHPRVEGARLVIVGTRTQSSEYGNLGPYIAVPRMSANVQAAQTAATIAPGSQRFLSLCTVFIGPPQGTSFPSSCNIHTSFWKICFSVIVFCSSRIRIELSLGGEPLCGAEPQGLNPQRFASSHSSVLITSLTESPTRITPLVRTFARKPPR